MASASPIRTGFSTAIRQPSLVAAEVAWRWSFGAAALLLTAGTVAGYLDGLAVTDRDLWALGSRNQDLVAAAIAHIFQGTGPRLLRALAVLFLLLGFLWSVAASLGRTVTLRTLIEAAPSARWSSMFGLHLTRAALAVCTLVAAFGTILFAAWISSSPDADGFVRPNETSYLLILLATLPLLVLLWNYLNWILSLAPIFVIHDGFSTLNSIARAIRTSRERRASLLGAAALFTVLRLIALAVLLMASLFVMAIFSAAGFRVMLAALILLSLAYFVVVDFLYVARLAANVEICQTDSTSFSASALPLEAVSSSPQQFSPGMQS
ncbi:MAG: hypothetical protein L0Z53_21785 [Acidobacteriales bacterium]|nr:hypothetical protein [Terriglobales bacterium]